MVVKVLDAGAKIALCLHLKNCGFTVVPEDNNPYAPTLNCLEFDPEYEGKVDFILPSSDRTVKLLDPSPAHKLCLNKQRFFDMFPEFTGGYSTRRSPNYYHKYLTSNGYIYRKELYGPEYSLDFYAVNGEYRGGVLRKRVYISRGESVGTCVIPMETDRLAKLKHIIGRLNYSGVGNLQFKGDFILELNARVAGMMPVSCEYFDLIGAWVRGELYAKQVGELPEEGTEHYFYKDSQITRICKGYL